MSHRRVYEKMIAEKWPCALIFAPCHLVIDEDLLVGSFFFFFFFSGGYKKTLGFLRHRFFFLRHLDKPDNGVKKKFWFELSCVVSRFQDG